MSGIFDSRYSSDYFDCSCFVHTRAYTNMHMCCLQLEAYEAKLPEMIEKRAQAVYVCKHWFSCSVCTNRY